MLVFAVCEPGSSLTQTGTCAPCAPSGATNYTATVFLILLVVLLLWLLYYLLLRSDRSMVDTVKDADEDEIDDMIRYDLYKKQCEFTLTSEFEMRAGYLKALGEFTSKQNQLKIAKEMKTRNTELKLRGDNPDDLDGESDDDMTKSDDPVAAPQALANAQPEAKRPEKSAAEQLGLDEDGDHEIKMSGESGDADAVSALFARTAMKLRRKRAVRKLGRSVQPLSACCRFDLLSHCLTSLPLDTCPPDRT